MTEYSKLEKIRLEKVETLRAEGIEPYPTRAERTHLSQEAIKAFEEAETAGQEEPINVILAGRLMMSIHRTNGGMRRILMRSIVNR